MLTRRNLVQCKFCAKAGNTYSYRSYHAMPVRHPFALEDEDSQGGGHVYQSYTTGSMLFGDNIGAIFLLATDMAVSQLQEQ